VSHPLWTERADDWRDRTTVPVPVAGALLDLCRNSAYTAAKAGEIPTIILGNRLVVPVAPLRRLLGELPPLEVQS
jgi:hypothetical protein